MDYVMEREVYVDDQRCGNCKWWYPDTITDELGCRLPGKVKKGKKTENTWCWKWQKGGCN